MTRIRIYVLLAGCLTWMGALGRTACGQTVTTTTLSSLPTGTVAAGSVVSLVASIQDSSGPVLTGQVRFYDSATLIGTVPVVRVATAGYTPGTATLPRIFGPGGHTIRATFTGTTTEQASTSAAASLTVASTSATPGPTLIYSNSRYFNQLARLEKFLLVDINNDGVLDLIAPQFEFANIAICLGDAAHPGAFLPPTFPSVGALSTNDAVAAADLNGDGLLDIVASDSDNGIAGILFQDPTHPGTFLPVTIVGVGPIQADPQIADINHDGVPDIVLFPALPQPAVSVLLGDPLHPGTFLLAQKTLLTNSDLRASAVADMDGDGLPDVILANYNDQTVTILLNNPASPGHFLPQTNYPAGPNFSVAIGDLNNDGLPDVVLGGLFSGVTVLLNGPAHPGQLLPPVSYPVSPTPAGGRSLGVAIGDVDGDGIPDVVSGNYGPVFDLLLGRGDGTLKPTISYNTGPTPSTFEGNSMAIGDVDGDGAADVLAGQFYQNDVQIFLHQASSPQRLISATDLVTPSVVRVGNPITINIKVSSAAGPPPGSISLYDSSGGASFAFLATLTLDASGSVTYTIPSPSLGFHDFLAHFPGDDLYSPSTSLIVPVVVISGPVASVNLTATPNPANVGQLVTFTANVTATGTPPTGNVVFLDGGTQIAAVTITAGTAAFATNSLIAGPHAIQAIYSGDTNYGSASSSTTEVIRYPPASISLSSSANPASAGQAITFKVQLSASGPPPTGQITFLDNGSQIAVVPVSGSGTATVNSSSLSVGTHTILATYSGDTNYSSQSATLSQIITAVSSATTLTAAPNPANFGQTVTLVAAITGSGTAPTGTITFYDGATQLASTPIVAGQATVNTTSLAVGTHTLTAIYSGSTIYSPSTSLPTTEIIKALTQDFTITLAAPTIVIQTKHHTTTTATITSLNGFSDSIAIVCANLPQYVTCKPTPTPSILAANGSTSVSLYIDTDSVLGYAHLNPAPPSPAKTSPVSLALLLSPFGLFVALASRSRSRSILRLLVLLLAAGTLSAAIGCGQIIYPYAVPPFAATGTYTIPVIATGASTNTTHIANLTLQITP